jgi:NAD(P)-dependent dehydrogenase (short-subunit alcohol dehydrogenase family)
MANMGAYTASKSAVIRITEAMSEELLDQNINVNCILPGVIDTPKNRSDMAGSDFSKWVSPSEIAEVIGFLASEKSVAINGASIPVYGRS